MRPSRVYDVFFRALSDWLRALDVPLPLVLGEDSMARDFWVSIRLIYLVQSMPSALPSASVCTRTGSSHASTGIARSRMRGATVIIPCTSSSGLAGSVYAPAATACANVEEPKLILADTGVSFFGPIANSLSRPKGDRFCENGSGDSVSGEHGERSDESDSS